MTLDLGNELLNLHATINQQNMRIDELGLKAAMYKAYFFHKDNLASKLDAQLSDNLKCYYGCDWIEYRNLDDMLADGLITEEEYNFCKV